MKLFTSCGIALLAQASLISCAQFDPYFSDMSFLSPRSLSTWNNLTVTIPSGTFVGLFNDSYPDVRQFLRVPFAQSPVGDLRWMPPQKPKNSCRKFDSTFIGPSCPQFVSASTTNFNKFAPSNMLSSIGETTNQGAIAWSSAEDCLSLAIWTPAYANKSSKLPVALFVTGGGGTTGGINIPSQMPAQWVSRSQEHIVVTINYRVNIFGNPKSRALRETSLSLLDVRAAVEFISENIEAFGGDPENIMLWGQSQGAALTHLYTLAFPTRPLVHKFGIISQPPSVTLNLSTTNDVYEDFDIVAKGLGCNYGDDYEAELECMRGISWVQIEEYINLYNGTMSISFADYIPDEKYIFANEAERYALGQVARGPAIRSDAEREWASNMSDLVAETEGQWICAAATDSARRKSIGLDTYRYYWAGNFSNISPEPWLGAWHWTDLLMIFGTYREQVGDISQLEVDTSETMQDYLLAFLKNANTVNETVGWQAFDASEVDGGVIVEFGRDTTAQDITGDYVDGGCYNSSIAFPISG